MLSFPQKSDYIFYIMSLYLYFPRCLSQEHAITYVLKSASGKMR